MSDVFSSVILIGRPAAGKSEIIDFLKATPLDERRERFHVGEMVEIDDFPYIWEKFEEDDLLERHGRERLFTTPDYYFKDPWIWNFFLLKMSLAYEKHRALPKDVRNRSTAFLEFSRGGENAFREAFAHLSDEIRRDAALIYIRVSYVESVRKNKRRRRPGAEHTILHHSLPDDKMERYYKTNDWDVLSKGPEGKIDMGGIGVPYVEFDNEPEVTNRPEALGARLEDVCTRLWMRAKNR